MSTKPNPDDSTDHLDATDLLTDDGTVDISTVRSLTSATNGVNREIDPERCGDLREHIAGTRHAGETAEAFGHSETAVRRHVKGECHHPERAVDTPTVSYTHGVGWEVDE